jgi:CRISPR-associated protein Csx14
MLESTMLATLGGQPQVVTFALDALLARGERIREVVVLHLGPENPRFGRALARLAAEFTGDRYQGRRIRFRPVPVRNARGRLPDIRDEVEAEAALRAIHELIATLKAQGRRLHVCIAGGRRLLALLAMSAAMLHFSHHDRMWHLYTPEDFLARADEGAIMHARPEDGVRLIQVPLVPWGVYFPQLRQLAQVSPGQVMAVPALWMDEADRRRCQAVIEHLTPRQCEVLRAFARGASPQEVAEALCITLSTVDDHKKVILAECRNAWELAQGTRLTYHFLREKFGLFFDMPL